MLPTKTTFHYLEQAEQQKYEETKENTTKPYKKKNNLKPSDANEDEWTVTQTKKKKSTQQRPSQQNKAVELKLGDSRTYNWRYDLVLKIEATGDSVKEFRDAAIKFLEEMQKTDKSLIIVPYKTEDYDKGIIAKMTKLPERSKSIETYFNGMIPKEKGGDIYTGIVLAHNKPFGEIKEDVKFWAREATNYIADN